MPSRRNLTNRKKVSGNNLITNLQKLDTSRLNLIWMYSVMRNVRSNDESLFIDFLYFDVRFGIFIKSVVVGFVIFSIDYFN